MAFFVIPNDRRQADGDPTHILCVPKHAKSKPPTPNRLTSVTLARAVVLAVPTSCRTLWISDLMNAWPKFLTAQPVSGVSTDPELTDGMTHFTEGSVNNRAEGKRSRGESSDMT